MKKTVILFTLLRYLEFGLFSLIVFLLAKRVSVEAYGAASSSFIWITLSAFFVLGCNQVLVKWHSKSSSDCERSLLILYNLLYNFVVAILCFVFIYCVIDTVYAVNVALIVFSKVLVESMATVNRVLDRFYYVNFIYLINVIILFIVFFSFDVWAMDQFFILWSCTILSSVFFGLFTVFSYIKLILLNRVKLVLYFLENKGTLFKDGVRLSIIGFLSPLVGSVDKLILSYRGYPEQYLGVMQLGDNIATVFSLSVGAFVFMLTPTCIRKLKNKDWDVKFFYKKGYLAAFCVLCVFCILIYFASFIVNIFFFKYENLFYPVLFYSLSRLLISALFMFNIIVLTYSLELIYVKLLMYFVALYIALLGVLSLFLSNYLIFFLFPVLGIFAMVLFHFISFFKIRRLVFQNEMV